MEALLTGWGRTAPTRARLHAPRDGDEGAARVAAAGSRGILARGLGRAYGDAAQNAGGDVVLTEGLSGVRSFDAVAGRVTVGAGTSLGELAHAALERDWFVPVVPGTRFVTVGGAIAADIHGKNHHRDGSFGDHVESLELLTPGGERMTVTPAGTPGAWAATVGGMGLSGIVLAATLRLVPVETDRVLVDVERARDLDDLLARMEGEDHRYRYSVAWIDCLERRRLGRGVLLRGNHARAGDLPEAFGRSGGARGHALAYAPSRALPGPPAVRLVSRATVRAFNELYYRRAPVEERGRLERLDTFFHPLDVVQGWNRLYGPRGFVQYQFVVPAGEEGVVRTVLERMSAQGRPTFLAVLKRFGSGAGTSRPLSFPAGGWTLAADLPAGDPELAVLLDGLDGLVAEARGRVYLAKDSRLRPEVLGTMYPGLEAWREARAGLDPQGRMRSDLGRRLGLA